MNNYKPYSYLYKTVSRPKKLKSCFVVWVPVGKKLTLRPGDPSTVGATTNIRYSVENDANQTIARQEEYEHEFNWDGDPHDVAVIIGAGEGGEGGSTTLASENAELT